MIDGGILLFIVAALLATVGPAEKLVVQHRAARVLIIDIPPLGAAFPFVPPCASIDDLVLEAEAALYQDDLLRGVRAIGDIYEPPLT